MKAQMSIPQLEFKKDSDVRDYLHSVIEQIWFYEEVTHLEEDHHIHQCFQKLYEHIANKYTEERQREIVTNGEELACDAADAAIVQLETYLVQIGIILQYISNCRKARTH